MFLKYIIIWPLSDNNYTNAFIICPKIKTKQHCRLQCKENRRKGKIKNKIDIFGVPFLCFNNQKKKKKYSNYNVYSIITHSFIDKHCPVI
jgi:hypothetical protein